MSFPRRFDCPRCHSTSARVLFRGFLYWRTGKWIPMTAWDVIWMVISVIVAGSALYSFLGILDRPIMWLVFLLFDTPRLLRNAPRGMELLCRDCGYRWGMVGEPGQPFVRVSAGAGGIDAASKNPHLEYWRSERKKDLESWKAGR